MRIILFTIITLTFINNINAQELPNKTKNNNFSIGLIYSPRAFTTFNGDDVPFKVDQTLYLVPSVTLNKWTLAPFYNFGGNRIGTFVSRAITKKESLYVFADQSLNTNFGAYGVGLTTVLYKDLAQGFIEIGGSRGINPEPAFLIGLYINFSKIIHKW